MEDFILKVTKNELHPWLIYSIIREHYNYDVFEYILPTKSLNDAVPLSAARMFLLKYKIRNNLVIDKKCIYINQDIHQRLVDYSKIKKIIPSHDCYETHILIAAYSERLVSDNLYSICCDFSSFTTLTNFIRILDKVSKLKITSKALLQMFIHILYVDLPPAKLKIAQNAFGTRNQTEYVCTLDELIIRLCKLTTATYTPTLKDLEQMIENIRIAIAKKGKQRPNWKSFIENEKILELPASILNALLLMLSKCKENVTGCKVNTYFTDMLTFINANRLEIPSVVTQPNNKRQKQL